MYGFIHEMGEQHSHFILGPDKSSPYSMRHLQKILGGQISSFLSELKARCLIHRQSLQNPSAGQISSSWSILKAPCLTHRPSQRSGRSRISPSGSLLQVPCHIHGPFLQNPEGSDSVFFVLIQGTLHYACIHALSLPNLEVSDFVFPVLS